MKPDYRARHDYNKQGCNCNPYGIGSNDWAEYEIAYQRHWAKLQGIDYGFN